MKAANKNNGPYAAAQNNIDPATRPESRQIKCYIDKDNKCYRVLEQNDQTPSSDQGNFFHTTTFLWLTFIIQLITIECRFDITLSCLIVFSPALQG